jgi:hypothetical protein
VQKLTPIAAAIAVIMIGLTLFFVWAAILGLPQPFTPNLTASRITYGSAAVLTAMLVLQHLNPKDSTTRVTVITVSCFGIAIGIILMLFSHHDPFVG